MIPEPRCLNNIRDGVAKNRYKDARDVYTDVSLVFWNALYYNEPGSQIADDALTLKVRKLPESAATCSQVQLIRHSWNLNGRKNPFCPLVLLHRRRRLLRRSTSPLLNHNRRQSQTPYHHARPRLGKCLSSGTPRRKWM